ncbi:cutinase family protein [Leucobacter sp. BZR 635]|uniref:cutinase family protein n=1 Tax=Leucobacter sp. BZR 635 TaxID=3378705 RepID=UPI003A8738E5
MRSPGLPRRRLAALGGVVVVATLLVGCAAEVDPAVTRDALQEVTAEPAPTEVTDAYDSEAFPEPIVEPLECSPYLVITARGTGEPPKKQLLAPVARAIAQARPDDVERIDLDYPADTEINAGGTLGARTLVDTLNVQAEACPDQGTILLGYSQGALVIGDALAEADTRLVGAKVGKITDEAAERIVAVVMYGNPRFVGVDPAGYGNFDPALNGLLPRPPGSFARFDDRMRDFCVADDFICQSTLALEESGHVAYYENGMQNDGAAFVISLLDPPADTADATDRAEDQDQDRDRDQGQSEAQAQESDGA